MSDPTDPQSWVERAEEDYELARLSIDRQNVLVYGAAFHAQQCAEKYLKAILLRHNLLPPRTHDLGALLTLCTGIDISLRIPVDELLQLNQYAVQVRYPGEDLSAKEAHRAVEIAKRVRAAARHILEIE